MTQGLLARRAKLACFATGDAPWCLRWSRIAYGLWGALQWIGRYEDEKGGGGGVGRLGGLKGGKARAAKLPAAERRAKIVAYPAKAPV